MNSWFEIGEQVILYSEALPEYNGEYIIEAVLDNYEPYICRLTGKELYTDEGIAYILSTPLLDLIEADGTECFISPTSLRKKHKPSDESFHSLMSSLKIKEGVS